MSVGALALGGCTKAESTGAGHQDPQPGAVPAPEPVVTPPSFVPTEPELALFPKSTSLVVGVNVDAWRRTRLFRWAAQHEERTQPIVAHIRKVCGIDIFHQLASVVLASDGGEPGTGALLVQGRIDEKRVNDCAQKIAAEQGADVKVRREGAITTYSDGKQILYASWLGAGTVLLSSERARIEDMVARKTSLRDNAQLGELLAKVDTREALWIAGSKDAPKWWGLKPKGFYATAVYRDAFEGKVGLVFASPAEAQSAAVVAKQEVAGGRQNPLVGPYLSNLSVENTGTETHLRLRLTTAEVDNLTGALIALADAAGATADHPAVGGSLQIHLGDHDAPSRPAAPAAKAAPAPKAAATASGTFGERAASKRASQAASPSTDKPAGKPAGKVAPAPQR